MKKLPYGLLAAWLALAAFAGNPYRDGAYIYGRNCANCHLENGEGLGLLIPPLTDAGYLEKNREKLPCILKYGLKDTIVVNGKTYTEQMAGIPELTPVDITNVLNYITHSWGNEQKIYQLDEVKNLLEDCAPVQ